VAAVGVEPDQADGEQLQQFAREVLVGAATGRRLVAVGQVQVLAHLRTDGHLAQQRAVVAEGVAAQQLQVGRRLLGVVVLVHRDHDDLAQRVGHPLAQLVGRRGQPVQVLRLHDAVVVDRVADGRFGHRELLGQPGRCTQCA
jgi:hypothetical protein